MRKAGILFSVLIFYCFGMHGQWTAENFIITNHKNGGIHYLETKPINLVVRANYSYDLFLVNGDEGILGNLISKDGAISERGDEIIFVSSDNQRKSFTFNNSPIKSTLSGRPIYQNQFTLDPEGMSWLIREKPVQFYLKNTPLHQMKKYTLPISRRQLLQELVRQFEQTLDYDLTHQPTITTYHPEKKRKAFTFAEAPSEESLADNEIILLYQKRDRLKASILKEIEEETLKAQRIKNDLKNDVIEARIRAENEENKYAQEVLDARRKSLVVIAEIKNKAQNEILEQKKISTLKKEEFARDVYQARLRSMEALEKTKIESGNKISAYQQELVQGIKKAEEKYKIAELEYDEEIKKTIKESQLAIVNIRHRASIKLDSLTTEYSEKQKNFTLDQQDKFQKENGKLLAFRKIIIDSLSKMEEILALKKEEYAQAIANQRIVYQEKLNSLQKEHSLAITENNKAAEFKVLQSKQNALLVENNYKTQIKKTVDQIKELKQKIEGRIDSINNIYTQKIIKDRHLFETKLQDIANAIIEAEHKKNDALIRIKGESEYDITAIQNIVQEERKKMLVVLEDERVKFKNKKKELKEIEIKILSDQKVKRDSIQKFLSRDVVQLKLNYNKAIQKIRHEKDSILVSLDKEYNKIKHAYADSITLISIKANKKIASIKEKQASGSDRSKKENNHEISLIEHKKVREEKAFKEKENMERELLSLRKQHQIKLSFLHEKLDSQIQITFKKINETKSAYRDEMNIMSSQLAAYKTQHQQLLLDENRSFAAKLALIRSKQLSQLLRLDSLYQSKKSNILVEHAAEFKHIRNKSQKRLTALQDSLRAIYDFENESLLSLAHRNQIEKDSLIRKQNKIRSAHYIKINESNNHLLKEILKNEEILTNEIYQSKQKARESIAKIKSNTLQEINDIIANKLSYEEELKNIEALIEQKKKELKLLEKQE